MVITKDEAVGREQDRDDQSGIEKISDVGGSRGGENAGEVVDWMVRDG